MANSVTSEIRYQVGEAWKGPYSAQTVYNVAAVVQDATGLSVYRSLKSGNAGHSLNNGTWWFKIIDLSGIKTESDRIAALNVALAQDEQQRVQAEGGRVAAEVGRVQAESGRVADERTRVSKENQRQSSESSRISNENTRTSKESQRQTAETGRVDAENGRVTAEDLRDRAESGRVTSENSRVAAERERVQVAILDHERARDDHATAAGDHATATEDHIQAAADHTQAASDHTQAGTDHTTAAADHTTAAADHTQAASDHTQAGTDHTTAAADHTQAAADHTQAESDHTRAEADHNSIASKANVCENAVEGNLPMVKSDGNTEDSGIPADAVAGIVLYRMGDAESNLMNMAEAMARELPDDGDADELPMLCGQPRKLYGTGAPEEATVPSNWRQLADGGYNWYGLPTAVGQEYIDTENGAKYEAVWNDYAQRTLKWLAV